MQVNFDELVVCYNSLDQNVRSAAQTQMNQIISNTDPNTIILLCQNLSASVQNNQNSPTPLFISMILKKIVESTITVENKENYKQFLYQKIPFIVETILNAGINEKIVETLVIFLCNIIYLYKIEIDDSDDALFNPIQPANPDMQLDKIFSEVYKYIFNYYSSNKNNLNSYLKSLYILFHLLKEMAKLETNLSFPENQDFLKICAEFTNDFSTVIDSLFMPNIPLEGSFKCLTYFLKLYKYEINLIWDADSRKKVMEAIYKLIRKILDVLLSKETIYSTENSVLMSCITNLYDCLFLSNRIIVKYLSFVDILDVDLVKKFTEVFYAYVSNEAVFNQLNALLAKCSQNSNFNFEYKQGKFLSDIMDFFDNVVRTTSYDKGENVLFSDKYFENVIQVSDYMNSEFFTKERMLQILNFTLEHCLKFSLKEIEMAKSDPEEFYTYFNSISVICDSRAKGCLLCRVLYDNFTVELKDTVLGFEQTLGSLIQKEIYSNQNNPNTALTFDEINMKCALLCFFNEISNSYFEKTTDYRKWIELFVLGELNEYLKNQNEFYSKFLSINLLSKLIMYQPAYKDKVLELTIKLFVMPSNTSESLIIKLGILDLYQEMIDDIQNFNKFGDYLQTYFFTVTQLLNETISPDIHSKIFKTSSVIITNFNRDQIGEVFPVLYPNLVNLWQSDWKDYSQEKLGNTGDTEMDGSDRKTRLRSDKIYTQISCVKFNLMRLVCLFSRKIGVIEEKKINANNFEFFNFVKYLIGDSIVMKKDGLNQLAELGFTLMLYIQDEYGKSIFQTLNENLREINFTNQYYPLFENIFDFINQLLDNLINCPGEYVIQQICLIEQFISLAFLQNLSQKLFSIDFLNKLSKAINTIFSSDVDIAKLHQFMFNFLEYLLYVYYSYSLYSPENLKPLISLCMDIIGKIFQRYPKDTITNIILAYKEKCHKDINDFARTDYINYDLSLFNGALQLSQRIIKLLQKNTNFCFDFGDNFFNMVVNNLVIILPYIEDHDIEFLYNQKQILKECYYTIMNCNNQNWSTQLNNLNLNIRPKGNFLNKEDMVSQHWLFAFNRMNNEQMFGNASRDEDLFRVRMQDFLGVSFMFDFSFIDFRIKKYFLSLDG
ncbi:MAG: hypothetical protein MJ252_15065 [archaeon]|nr:hypothetical protein [archaeon]